MLKRILALCCLGVVLAGCNTVAGVGRDVERGGEMLQDTARDTQRKL
jgi:entericidin B